MGGERRIMNLPCDRAASPPSMKNAEFSSLLVTGAPNWEGVSAGANVTGRLACDHHHPLPLVPQWLPTVVSAPPIRAVVHQSEGCPLLPLLKNVEEMDNPQSSLQLLWKWLQGRFYFKKKQKSGQLSRAMRNCFRHTGNNWGDIITSLQLLLGQGASFLGMGPGPVAEGPGPPVQPMQQFLEKMWGKIASDCVEYFCPTKNFILQIKMVYGFCTKTPSWDPSWHVFIYGPSVI